MGVWRQEKVLDEEPLEYFKKSKLEPSRKESNEEDEGP